MQLTNKEKVAAVLKMFGTKDPGALQYIHPDKYIQHNLRLGNGVGSLRDLIAGLPDGGRVTIARIMEDGDYVFAHTEYDLASRRIGFDVFRFEDGLIVEHWDNLQTAEGPNPSGHTMIDGATEIVDHDKTAANKELVRSNIDDIINGRFKGDTIATYYDGDNYIQHNPWIGDTVSGLFKGFAAWTKEGITLKYVAIHKVLGEGNFALVISEAYFKGVHSAFYDFYRIADGKIAEHWDTIEEIPALANHKNPNGKF